MAVRIALRVGVPARIPPDEWQCERAGAEQCNNDTGGVEIPFTLGGRVRWKRGMAHGTVEKFAAMLAFDGVVLDLFSAVGTVFHGKWMAQPHARFVVK